MKILGKYPDISTIKRHPAHKDLTLSTRYSKKILSRISKSNVPDTRIFSNSVLNVPSKLNTFNSKRTSPLPPLSYSVDAPYDFLIITAEEGSLKEPRKLMQKLQTTCNYDQFNNTYMRRFIKEHPEKKKNFQDEFRGVKDYPLDFGQGSKSKKNESRIYEKVKGKFKVVNVMERKKDVRESDVQTNETEFEFHLIYDDQGNETELALQQSKMIHAFETLLSRPPN